MTKHTQKHKTLRRIGTGTFKKSTLAHRHIKGKGTWTRKTQRHISMYAQKTLRLCRHDDTLKTKVHRHMRT